MRDGVCVCMCVCVCVCVWRGGGGQNKWGWGGWGLEIFVEFNKWWGQNKRGVRISKYQLILVMNEKRDSIIKWSTTKYLDY